ncbi:MAG TPA: hypothetical protein VL295_07770, partial [Gemmatimonadales bacterium]|nr:hypothetical protein [Gemmatimonadales bacterium]
QFVIPMPIQPLVLGVIVHRTIQLDDQSELCTEEVHDETLDDLLPTKVPAIDLTATQERPCDSFCGRRFSSESPSDLDLRGCVVARADVSPERLVSDPTR